MITSSAKPLSLLKVNLTRILSIMQSLSPGLAREFIPRSMRDIIGYFRVSRHALTCEPQLSLSTPQDPDRLMYPSGHYIRSCKPKKLSPLDTGWSPHGIGSKASLELGCSDLCKPFSAVIFREDMV